MKKTILLSLIVLNSCGNPHLKSPNIPERVRPPITPEPPEQLEPKVDFFLGVKETAYPYLGEVTSGFKIGLRSLQSNDLNLIEVGQFLSVDFMAGKTTFNLTHKTEAREVPENVNELAQIYSSDDYDIFVKEPIEFNGVAGQGRGVDTDSFDALTKDVMLIQFSAPLRAFGGYFLDLESTSFLPAIIRAFDCRGKLVASHKVIYPDNTTGQEEFHFVGFKAQNIEVCALGVTVGDLENQTGVYRGLALDEVVFQK